MESQMALNAIQLGFSINTIRVVLLEKIQLGLDFTTGDDLIEVLTEHKVCVFSKISKAGYILSFYF